MKILLTRLLQFLHLKRRYSKTDLAKAMAEDRRYKFESHIRDQNEARLDVMRERR